jgi:lipopolysaccharide/colanic/teichoic acid biosynthesis glycosyltransferase
LIRLLDILFSGLGLIILSPILFVIAVIIMLDSRGGVFYRQERVGRWGKPFQLYKFRTMRIGSDQQGLLTIGGRDNRITQSGYWLRKYKLDELPQLINVVIGDMSLVGPRPEVERYTHLYTESQRAVLAVRPGITDPASIYYRDENEVLAGAENPEQMYIDVIMPHKLALNKLYIDHVNVANYLKLIFITIFTLFRKRKYEKKSLNYRYYRTGWRLPE